LLFVSRTNTMVMQGTRERPIPRDVFSNAILSRFNSNLGDSHQPWSTATLEYSKVVPTLVLFPDDCSSSIRVDVVATQLRTVLKSKDGDFEEALVSCQGKALVLNFCTSSLEAYPKSLPECRKIYDMHALEHTIVPSTKEGSIKFLQDSLQQSCPLRPHAVEWEQVLAAMTQYKQALGREAPWRLAFNLPTTAVVAEKLSGEVLNVMLPAVGRTDPYRGERLYREETYTPAYEFGCGDFAVVDLDAPAGAPKLDKHGKAFARTVNRDAFEMTYGLSGAC